MRRSLSVLALLFVCAGAAAQQPSLREEIAAADRAMFDAYNAHDADRLLSFFAKDVEFFHDKNGLVSYEQLAKGFREIVARNDGIRRDLVGEIEVHPIKNYGAIEIGAHRFCHVENGKDDCGTFKFVHVWKKTDGAWKVARVISYGH